MGVAQGAPDGIPGILSGAARPSTSLHSAQGKRAAQSKDATITSNMPDPYYLLGVPQNASSGEIRAAYRRRATESHPDRQPPDRRAWAEEQMKQLNAARDILLDPRRRAEHDAKIRLEVEKARWRARQEAFVPPDPPPGTLRRRRRHLTGGWFILWVFILCVLILGVVSLFVFSSSGAALTGPLALVAGLARCVGGLFLTSLVLMVIAYLLSSFAQSLRN